jgi:hypothetical protein
VRTLFFFVCAASLGFAAACDSGSSSDGGTDATSEQVVDICSTFTTAGDKCLKASNVVCFRDYTCEAGNGCTCKDSDGGPTWECYTPPECIHPCSSSPLVDAECPDASDGATTDDGGDAGDDGAADAAAE